MKTLDLDPAINELEIVNLLLSCDKSGVSEAEKQKHIARLSIIRCQNSNVPFREIFDAYKERWGLK